MKEQLEVNPLVTPTQLHISVSTTLKERFAKAGVVSTNTPKHQL
jgi:hypothetical protein